MNNNQFMQTHKIENKPYKLKNSDTTHKKKKKNHWFTLLLTSASFRLVRKSHSKSGQHSTPTTGKGIRFPDQVNDITKNSKKKKRINEYPQS